MPSVCPFCQRPITNPNAQRCPSCGRQPSIRPATGAADVPDLEIGVRPGARPNVDDVSLVSGWDADDFEIGELDLSRGGSLAAGMASPSTYGGEAPFGNDDDPLADGEGHAALELDLPAPRSVGPSRSIPAPRSFGPTASRPPASEIHAAEPERRVSLPSGASRKEGTPSLKPHAALDPEAPPRSGGPVVHGEPPVAMAAVLPAPPDPAAMIARYSVPPNQVWKSPLYALKVLWRQFELHQDLASLRKRRSPDVPLYERALKTYDQDAFTRGLTLTCIMLVIAGFIFFLPVILRFARLPD